MPMRILKSKIEGNLFVQRSFPPDYFFLSESVLTSKAVSRTFFRPQTTTAGRFQCLV